MVLTDSSMIEAGSKKSGFSSVLSRRFFEAGYETRQTRLYVNNEGFFTHYKRSLYRECYTKEYITRSISIVSKSMPSLRSSIRLSDDIITSSTIGSSSSSIRPDPRRLKRRTSFIPEPTTKKKKYKLWFVLF